MSFIIKCECGQQMTVQDEHVGREVMCVNCLRAIRVPERSTDPAQVPVAPLLGAGHTPRPSGVIAPPQGPPSAPPGGQWRGGWQRPHRGSTILALGIVSIVLGCCCAGLWAGLPAIIMGINDLNEMKDGRMDPSGRSLTLAGLICGMAGLAMLVLPPILNTGWGWGPPGWPGKLRWD